MLWLRYSTATCVHGALHSVVNLWDKTGSYYNHARNKAEKRQLLILDKFGYARNDHHNRAGILAVDVT